MNEIKLNMVKGLDLFTTTADQRFMLGSDIFLRTHYPIQFRKYQDDENFSVESDVSILSELLFQDVNVIGNRIWIIYGAPGSGKSEFMKWIQIMVDLKHQKRASMMTRIARHEISALKIFEKFKGKLGDDFHSEIFNQRLKQAQQKPRTISKLILLWTLERLIDSDELINALFYRLINDFQPYIDILLEALSGLDSIDVSSDIFGLEVWEEINNNTSIKIPIGYEEFRYELVKTFRDHFMEGLSLPDILEKISEHSEKSIGSRPILIIDDLVQSMNVFATDILDYFLSLESGNWDVIIGLTPAAFEISARGKDLLNRISYLDTIDDRVQKLWLTDERGTESFILDEGNCHRFIENYLVELQRINKWGDNSLFPFNEEVLIRIFREIPPGKGKSRYFLENIKDIFLNINKGLPLLEAIDHHARKDFVALTDDDRVASIVELYGPILEDDQVTSIQIQESIMELFGLGDSNIKIDIEPLIKVNLEREAIIEIEDDEEKLNIRDWLLSRSVNRQMLNGVRRGVARWLRIDRPFYKLHHNHISKPHGLIHWRKRYLGVRPSIYLEGIDEVGEGITITRGIGTLAFDFHRFSNVIGKDTKLLISVLANEPSLVTIFFDATEIREKIILKLSSQLNFSLEKLILGIYLFLLVTTDEISSIPIGLNVIHEEIRILKTKINEEDQFFNSNQVKIIINLYEDFFKLRENIFDGIQIQNQISSLSIEELWKHIVLIDPSKLGKEFRLGKIEFSNFLQSVQDVMTKWFSKFESRIEKVSDSASLLARIRESGIQGLSADCINENEFYTILALPDESKRNIYLILKE